MPSSAPGIFSLCREPDETATASRWRHRLWHCDAERGRKRWTRADAMYQGNGQTEALPIAMVASWQRFEIVGECDGLMRGLGNNPRQRLNASSTATACSTVPTTGDLGRLHHRHRGLSLRRSISHGERNSSSSAPVTGSGARNFASCSGPDESAASQATDGVRARLRERVKRSAQFTSCVGCYETVVLRARAV
jgi:hypothetical protein